MDTYAFRSAKTERPPRDDAVEHPLPMDARQRAPRTCGGTPLPQPISSIITSVCRPTHLHVVCMFSSTLRVRQSDRIATCRSHRLSIRSCGSQCRTTQGSSVNTSNSVHLATDHTHIHTLASVVVSVHALSILQSKGKISHNAHPQNACNSDSLMFMSHKLSNYY